MKVKEKRVPLWLIISLCVGIIWVIFFLFVKFLSDQISLSALAYLLAASAITAGGCVAYRHLRIIQGTERAAVLTSLDSCWYGYLADSRSEFLKFRNSLKSRKNSKKYQQEIRRRLQTTRKREPDTYRSLVGMLDFYETLGYFSRVTYILTRDVIQVYGPNIKDYNKIFHEYILRFQKAEKDTSIYENFLWLTDELKKQYN